DQVIYQMEKLLKEHAAKITDNDRAPIQAAIEKVKQAASKDDAREIRTAIEELQQASQAMVHHLYKQPGGQGPSGDDGQGGAGPSSPGPGGKDEVIDAEYEVKK